ncbi:G-type lectin S-receptor-like serine/threonine-protein kinase At4g27290 isoform X1 [Arachis hypogaea]|uniref:G-type lectin S-receptor-like serine/threonine-protein kinase At4g27290 isoform X1 n=2 Tax=Arachis TaxID=3817 RepID=UPI003B218331
MMRTRAICFLLLVFITKSFSLDMITPSQSMKDGDTLVSAGGTFELGFFRPGDSSGRYLGIWYKQSPSTLTWVANRNKRINSNSSVLEINNQGVLVLHNGSNKTFWSSKVSKAAENPVAQLLDSGNLVVRDGNGGKMENLLWQSFDYPCDTLLPGMKLGWNLETGLNRFLTCWKSTDDPDSGDYSFKIDLRGYPQAVQLKGDSIMSRAGSWNGLSFTALPYHKQSPVFKSEFVLNEKEIFYEFQVLDNSTFFRYIMTSSGNRQLLHWTSETNVWETLITIPSARCDNYALCGENSVCNSVKTPDCACLEGFAPKVQREWDMSYWSNGCVRITPLSCSKDGFMKYTGIILPDTSSSRYNKTIDLQECESLCLQNCSCTAYANLDKRDGGSGCLLWFGDLIDMRQSYEGGQDIYIRVPSSELEHNKKIYKKKLVGIITGSAVFMICLILGLAICLWKNKFEKPAGMSKVGFWKELLCRRVEEDSDIPTFDLSTIFYATNCFSSYNKLGAGGFGLVYKGVLADGTEIAVKRLSKNSEQGQQEFKTEVQLIAKLQHRNLVKLLGCCIKQKEKLLIYEFMPNRSLDHFIFDDGRRKLLDWTKRFQIISGIARGLLYLHHDSRLRIIHRDLKTSNILLDNDMNPKISDFGLARTFGGDQTEACTRRVMGTHGYISPEYAMHGSFSMKSDVFSFGVIMLEVVSGMKNKELSIPHQFVNLLGHANFNVFFQAWELWTKERAMELVDKSLGDSVVEAQVLRCIHIGLLCVQERPEHRPNMSSVIHMLNDDKPLARPKQPAFYPHQESNSSTKTSEMCSNNDISITLLEAR